MISEDKRLRDELVFDAIIAEKAETIWHWGGYAGQVRWRRRAEMIANKIRQNSSGTILEIGSGTGILTQDLVKRLENLGTYVSSDISLSLLNKAKKKPYPPERKLRFLINNAYCNGIKNDSIDVIAGMSVLHHLDLHKSLNEFKRILKPKGIAVFTEPNYLNPHVFLERKIPYLRKKLCVSKYETAFIRWGLYNKLKKVGFKNIEIYPFDFVYPFINNKGAINTLKTLGNLLEQTFLMKEFAGSLFITFQK